MPVNQPNPSQPSQANTPLDLAGFRDVPDDQGMTLDNLSSAFAEMLGRGEEPYESTGVEGSTDPIVEPRAVSTPTESPPSADDACEVTPRSILEAMLFVGNPDGSPLSAARVAGLMRGVRAAEIEQFVAELNEQYAANRCPYEIVTDADGYRLTLRAPFEPLRATVLGHSQERRLSTAAVEVLSIVAYKGPLTGEAVSRLRGKPSGALLTQLVRRQLLRIDREPAKPGRYVVTERLLKLAGLASLEDLPRAHDLYVN